jgi:hypothetical protein
MESAGLSLRKVVYRPWRHSGCMKRTPKHGATRKPLRPKGSARVIEESTAPPPVDSAADPGLLERPDGWYWTSEHHQEFGPFESRASALADRDRFDRQGLDAPETVQEAESEIGIADWIDGETGEPAEGQSPPHVEE